MSSTPPGALGGGVDEPAGRRRALAGVSWVLERATRDGHTAVPASTVARVLAGYGFDEPDAAVDAAVTAAGPVVALGAGPGRRVALGRLAEAEAAVAAQVRRLSVSVAVARTAPAARRAAESAGPDTLVVHDAASLDVPAALDALSPVADGTRVVLIGDPGGLASVGPGRVLADLAGSQAVTVSAAPGPVGGEPGAALTRVADGLAAGVLVEPGRCGREVVVVAARGDREAVHRAGQLVEDSIPRALGIPAGQVAVLSPRRRGVAGAQALGGCTVAEAAGRSWPAVVLVLPAEAAGSLTRALVATAVARAGRHLSVVNAAGPVVAHAVARHPGRPRITSLGSRLRG